MMFTEAFLVPVAHTHIAHYNGIHRVTQAYLLLLQCNVYAHSASPLICVFAASEVHLKLPHAVVISFPIHNYIWPIVSSMVK